MVMRWNHALVGLVATLVIGIGLTRYIGLDRVDLGTQVCVDCSGEIRSLGYQLSDLYVDFDESMQTSQYANRHPQEGMQKLLAYFRLMYQKTNFLKASPQTEVKIPKIFHYIWLDKKLPAEFLPYLESWRHYHPDWTFVYWVDNSENYDLGQLLAEYSFDDLSRDLSDGALAGKHIVIDVKNLSFDNRALFDEATNYGERSDILKWEVVYRFGGTYIDVDFECLKPFDVLHHTYDFYTGIQPLDTDYVQLGAGLFSAISGHPILKHCVQTIKDNGRKKRIIARTGPLHFTKSFLAQAGAHKLVDVALPASYFYPCGYTQKGTSREEWVRPESFAVHH